MNHSQRCSTGVNGADREIGADCPGDECLGLIVASPKRDRPESTPSRRSGLDPTRPLGGRMPDLETGHSPASARTSLLAGNSSPHDGSSHNEAG